MFDNLFSLFYVYARPFIKWFLRKFTRLCELQRICYGAEAGAARYRGIEQSLTMSRHPEIKMLIIKLDEHVTSSERSFDEFRKELVPYALKTVLTVKEIKPKIHPDFGPLFQMSIETIWGYKRLYSDIEAMRKTTYDCDNREHEQKLLQLWKLLNPDQILEARVSKQWQDIGFQGDNPMTDFRGMGILGLDNLIFFAEEYNGAARHVLSHSLHPRYGYTFAIVGINLTSLAYDLVKTGEAKTHIYNLGTNNLSLIHFHRFYCYLFYEFDKFWMECKPTSLMEFSNIHKRFLNIIRTKLNDNRTIFKMNLLVENI